LIKVEEVKSAPPLCGADFFVMLKAMEKIIIYTDGGARGNPGPAAIGVQVQDDKGKVLKEVSQTIGNSTNNIAEYMGVVEGLKAVKELFGKKTKEMEFEVRMDSELIQKQLSAEYQIKEPGLIPYFIEIHNMRVASFPNLTLIHVKREKNKEADRLVNEALDQ
jgi:ribonuclease HI